MTVWVDAILAFLVVEALALALYHRWTGRGPALTTMLPTLAAGAALLAAMRLALAGAPLPWVVLTLGLAGLFHLTDLTTR